MSKYMDTELNFDSESMFDMILFSAIAGSK